ncbi:putative gustatory receptor 58a [Musca vetustissima]|uniref:putative gustatory receptor 58a n=1 Tax=Musca vetustissima TaxID=27455 RepID=UPI002AB6A906|nr:putative gustatory receptor 58a [Musca vetustissima]
MALRINERLEKTIWWTNYYYVLAMGLMPGLYNKSDRKLQYSKPYIIYSAVIQCFFLLITPLATPFVLNEEAQEEYYMYGKFILKWTYYIGKMARILVNIVMCIEIWLRREQVIELSENYWKFEKKYRQFYKHHDMQQYMEAEVTSVRTKTIYKFCVGHGNAILVFSLFIQIQNEPSKAYVLMIIVNLLQSYYLLHANFTFDLILFRMYLHFVYIIKSLQHIVSHKSPTQNPDDIFWRYWILYDMHFECYQLSKRILKICQNITFFMLIKIFTTNIVLLYHAVQFINGTIEADNTKDFMGTMSIVGFYWDTTLTMMAIDGILSSCNETSEILKLYANEEHIEHHHGQLQQQQRQSPFSKMASLNAILINYSSD